MSGSYLVGIGKRATSESASVGLAHCYEQRRAAIWTDGLVIPLGSLGCVIGHLFPKRPGAAPLSQFDPAQYHELEESAGRILLTDFWGGYIALLAFSTGEMAILRDPSGAVPCYYGRSNGGITVSSDAWRVVSQSDAVTPVDYVELTRFLAAPHEGGRSTCLKGIHELLPGEALVIKDQSIEIQGWWSPWSFARSSSRNSLEEDAAKLGHTIRDCVGRWASCFDNIVLGVSGGLDSSIVAETCAAAGRRPRCLTMVGPDPSGDESGYARSLTGALSLPLSIHQYDLGAIDLGRTVLAHLPRPLGAYFLQGLEQAHVTLAREQPIDALFTGHGGDNVFCSIRSVAPLLDRLQDEGIGPGILRTWRDLADLTGASFATILRLAFRVARQRRQPVRRRTDVTGLSKEMAQCSLATSRPTHPWVDPSADSPPGKRAHVAMLASALSSAEFYDRGRCPPQVAPLLSQPVLEICLSIPSWQWIEGGIDRSVARCAFRDSLPDILLDRTSKGGPDGFMHAIYRAREQELKAILRGGLLMAHGVLDPAYIDQPDDPTWQGKPRARRMMSLGIAEAWARGWSRQATVCPAQPTRLFD